MYPIDFTYGKREIVPQNGQLNPEDVQHLKKLMKDQLLSYITYSTFREGSCILETEQQVVDLCKRFGVDCSYGPDRVAFFKSLLEAIP